MGKRNMGRRLALLLAFSMAVSPSSCIKIYAAETEQTEADVNSTSVEEQKAPEALSPETKSTEEASFPESEETKPVEETVAGSKPADEKTGADSAGEVTENGEAGGSAETELADKDNDVEGDPAVSEETEDTEESGTNEEMSNENGSIADWEEREREILSAPSALSITSQPKEETIAMAGASVTLLVAAEGDDLSYTWQFSSDGTTWADCTGDSARTADYSFTMASDIAGQYRCVVKDKNGTEVVSDTAVVREPITPIVTGDKVKVVKEDGSGFKMFMIDKSFVEENGGRLHITVTTKNTSYNKLYFGSKDDADKASYIQGTELAGGGWSFAFTRPSSDKRKVLPVALGYPAGSKKGWYDNQYLWIYIPDNGEIIPNIKDGISAVVGGTGSPYHDFKVVSSKAVLKDGEVRISLVVEGQKWTHLYLGTQADANKTPFYSGTYDASSGTTTFTFAVPVGKQGMNLAITPGTKSGWFSYARDLFINIPKLEEVANTAENGIYDLYGAAYPKSNYASLSFERGSSIAIKGDTATVTMITQAAAYDKIYIGSVGDADSVKDAHAVEATPRTEIGDAYRCFTFTIPAKDIGAEVNYVVHIKASDSWAARQSSFWINSVLEKTGEISGTDPDPGTNPDPGTDPDQKPDSKLPENGVYQIAAETNAAMFNIVEAVLTVKNGKMTARVTLSGTGQSYLYMGTKEEAAASSQSSWIAPVGEKKYTDENGFVKMGYQFEIPVSALDTVIQAASYSSKNKIWYDRTITFRSDTLRKVSDLPGDGNNPVTPPPVPGVPSNPGNTGGNASGADIPDNDGKADNESMYESDTSGSTSRVDSATTLADGVYKPDRFSWSGGTGRVRLTCNKITVTNGRAYATLAFSSDSYQYVKANGNTYYATKSRGTSTVVIPVALNKNNRILGMTTKMSASHEIAYDIFIYLAAAGNGQDLGENSNKELDEEAPEIMGLEYKSETKLDYAEYFKIYHYDQGIVLLEIDMTRDTARDPEEETISLEEGEAVVNQKEAAAELYKGNVVKYLLVPENVEIPVGLEQDMILVNLPLAKTYAASNKILKVMEELGLLDQVTSVGCGQTDCEVDFIAKRMEETDGGEAKVSFGGPFDDLDYKTLIKRNVDLAIMPEDLLPREAEGTEAKLTAKEQTERFEEITGRLAMLGIPVIVDRSADEQTDLAKKEWVKVYGVLFGCEEVCEKSFETAVKEAGQENR